MVVEGVPNTSIPRSNALTGTELRPIETAPWIGGDLSLDFVNTAGSRSRGPLRDRIETYQDLVRWSELAGTIDETVAGELLRMAEAEPAAAAKVLTRAKALREAIYRVFAARADGRAAEAADLNAVSNAAAEAAAHRALVPVGFGFEYAWSREPLRLERVWWPVAAAAVALATSDRVKRVKECATAHCNWLFVDASRNRSRRWCQMSECGNREKQRRYQARLRAAPAATEKAGTLRNPVSSTAYKTQPPTGRRARPDMRSQ